MTTGTAAIIEAADIAAARGVIPDTAAIIEGADVLAANATVAPPAKQVQSYTHLIRQAFYDVIAADAFFAGYTIRKNRMLRIQHELLPYLGVYIIDENMLPDGDANLQQLPQMDNGALLVVGPEGGLSDNDIAMLTQTGFRGLRMGPRILRTETAGLAALAALQALHGDL